MAYSTTIEKQQQPLGEKSFSPLRDIPLWLKMKYQALTPWQEEKGQTFPEFMRQATTLFPETLPPMRKPTLTPRPGYTPLTETLEGIGRVGEWWQRDILDPIGAYASLPPTEYKMWGQPEKVVERYKETKLPWGQKGMMELMLDPLIVIGPWGKGAQAAKGIRMSTPEIAKFIRAGLEGKGIEGLKDIVKGLGKAGVPRDAAERLTRDAWGMMGGKVAKVAEKIPEVAKGTEEMKNALAKLLAAKPSDPESIATYRKIIDKWSPESIKGKYDTYVKVGAIKPEVAPKVAETIPTEKVILGIGKQADDAARSLAKPPSVETGILGDLSNFDETIKIASTPDNMRRLANVPAFKGLSKFIGGLAAIAKKPVEWAIVGRAMLRAEGQTKAIGVMSTLKQYGTSQKLFGLADDGTFAAGRLKGVHLNTVRTYPSKYWDDLTRSQRQWIEQANKIEKDKLALLKRAGIEINELVFEEGGEYAGRRVVAKLTPEGELLEAAYVGGGVGRIGAKAAFEKTRVFSSMQDAIKEGFRYLPEEDALHYNTLSAYNRVADKQMSEWLLERIPWRTTAAPQELVLAAEVAGSKLKKAQSLLSAMNRAIRGEKLPETTLKALETAFPEVNLRGALGDVKALRGLRPQIKELIKDARTARNQVVNLRAEAREVAMRATYEEARIAHPAFAGKILTGTEARKTAEIIRKELTPEFNKALGAMNKANAVGRYFVLAGDASPMTIQLLFLAGANPKVYGRALGGFVQALFDPEFISRYLAKHNATIQSSRNLILSTGGGTEFTEAMARGGLLRTKPLSWAGKILEPFQRGFETALDVAGIEMREAYAHLANTPAKAAQLESFINEFRGLANSARIGVSVGQRQGEIAALLAPRYNRAIAALLADVFRGGLRGKMARESLAKGITAISAMGVAISLARGESGEEAVEHLMPVTLDGKSNPKFLTWEVGGQMIGPGSKVRSVIKLFGDCATSPEDLFKISMENPGLRFVRGNLAPVARTGLDILVGTDYLGDPTRDGLMSLSRTVLARNMMPVWVQSVLLEGEEASFGGKAIRGVAEFMGMRAREMSPSEKRNIKRDELAQKEYGMDWEDLASPKGPGKLAQLKLEDKHPELQELTEKAEESWAKMARGEGKVFNEWRAVRKQNGAYLEQDINRASEEFRKTKDGTLFRQKINDAFKVYRARDEAIQENPQYGEVYKYFDEPLDPKILKEMNPNDIARRAYYDMMYAPGLEDEFGNYNFDEAERRKQEFTNKYGLQALDYVQEYMGIGKTETPELRTLRYAQQILKPYWQIEDYVWAKYPPELRQLSDQIEIIGKTNPQQEKQMLSQYPMILYNRKVIGQMKKQMREQNPDIQTALRLFYSY